MATNNPPIAAWAPSTALAELASRQNNAPCVLTDGPAEFNDVALIRLSDYERLQAECEEELFQVRQDRDAHFGELMRAIEQVDAMKAECEELRTALAESRANDLTAMGYLNQIRQLVGGDDFPDMVRRCEKLRKDAERYRYLADECCAEWCGEKGPVLVHATPWTCNWRAELDASIDAAMETTK